MLRSLTGLGDHILSADLEDALEACAAVIVPAGGEAATAAAIREASGLLRADGGTLQSRSTRVGGSS